MQEGAYRQRSDYYLRENDEIAAKILSEMERGATFLKAVGSYTKVERNVLYCVVAKMKS